MTIMDQLREKELLSRLSDAIESGKLKELERAREALRKFYDQANGGSK